MTDKKELRRFTIILFNDAFQHFTGGNIDKKDVRALDTKEPTRTIEKTIAILAACLFALALSFAFVSPAFADGTLTVKSNDGNFDVYVITGADEIPASEKADMPALADKLASDMKTQHVTPNATVPANGTVSLPAGEYLIVGGAGNAAMIAIVNDSKETVVNDKASYPTQTQWVDSDTNSTAIIHKREDVAVGKYFANETRIKLPANLIEYSCDLDSFGNPVIKAKQVASYSSSPGTINTFAPAASPAMIPAVASSTTTHSLMSTPSFSAPRRKICGSGLDCVMSSPQTTALTLL